LKGSSRGISPRLPSMAAGPAAVVQLSAKDPLTETLRRTLELWDSEPWIPMDLHTACGCGDIEQVKVLLDAGDDPNKPNRGGWTPLCYAAFFGFERVAQMLLTAGKADVNATGVNGMSPLMWSAACSNNEGIIRLMLKHKANLNAVDDTGRCALAWAVLTEQKMAARVLLESGADIEARRGKHARTSLLMAVASRSEVMVDLLLGAEANSDAVDKSGKSALDLAHEKPYSSAIVNLLKRGCRESKEKLRSPADVGTTFFAAGAAVPTADLADVASGARTAVDRATSSPSRRRLSGAADCALHGVSTIEEFLKRLKLSKYLPLFEEKGIDFKTFIAMDEAKLKAIGLTLFGPRRKIYFATQQWQDKNPSA